MNVIAIIPARGGSKRIPGKNIIPLLGVPLIEHTIHHAKASKHINRVVVSTDDREIMHASWKAGAGTVTRPADLSGDYEQPESALIYTMDFIETTYGDVFDLLVFLQCTSPIRRHCDIDRAIELAQEKRASVFSATAIWHYMIHDGYGNWFQNHSRERSQDREPALAEDGNLYVMKPEELKYYENRMCILSKPYIMPWWCGIEIDDEEDLETCEVIMNWKASELAWMP